MAHEQQDAANTGAYLIRGAAILGGAAEDLLIRDGIIAERGAGDLAARWRHRH